MSEAKVTVNHEAIWADTLEQIKLQMLVAAFEANLSGAEFVDLTDGVLRFSVKSDLAAENVNKRPSISGMIARTADLFFGGVDRVIAISKTAVKRTALATLPKPVQNGRNAQNGHPVSETGETGSPLEIGIVSSEPLARFVAVPHYAVRFWGSLLGSTPFALWQVLRSYGYYAQRGRGDWPTISTIVDTMGRGVSRAAIVGRNETAKRRAQIGAIDVLKMDRLIYHQTIGNERQSQHKFLVLDNLPMLAPVQVQQLSSRKQAEHDRYLDFYKGFNKAAWENLTIATLIPDRS